MLYLKKGEMMEYDVRKSSKKRVKKSAEEKISGVLSQLGIFRRFVQLGILYH